MPQSLRTLLLTCLAWFMPLHALHATTGHWHSAEAAELSSAAETAWLAGDWLIDTRAPAGWGVPGVELAELQRSTASAARLSVPTVQPANAVVQVLGHGAHLRPLHTLAPGERIAWDGHVWLVDSVEGAVDSATAAVASGSADPARAEGPAPVDVTAAVEPPAALHVTLQATGLRLQRVLATRARPADDVHTLTVRSADGTLQSIRGTADHPVYVQGGDTFQALATLRPGDAVRALDGRPSTLVAVTPDPGPRTVHNLTVEFAPTYFIDAEVREGWGGIWVHNSCECSNQYPERLERELANAARAGVVPIGPGDRRFNAVLRQGTINWAVLQNGELVVSPSSARSIPINHSILSGGAPVLAAGQAQISVGGGIRFAAEINNNSGHFRPGAESLEIGRQAFERAGVTVPSRALNPHVP